MNIVKLIDTLTKKINIVDVLVSGTLKLILPEHQVHAISCGNFKWTQNCQVVGSESVVPCGQIGANLCWAITMKSTHVYDHGRKIFGHGTSAVIPAASMNGCVNTCPD